MCHALLLSLSAVSMSLVCEEDGTEVDSDDFLMTLPDNTMLMALQPGETWKPQPVRLKNRKTADMCFKLKNSGVLCLIRQGSIVLKSSDHNKPRTGKDIARVTFDLYRISPKDIFGSLSVKATFQGLYSVSADFQCLGPKKVLRYANQSPLKKKEKFQLTGLGSVFAEKPCVSHPPSYKPLDNCSSPPHP